MVTRKHIPKRRAVPITIVDNVPASGPDYLSVSAPMTITESVTIARGPYPGSMTAAGTGSQNRLSSRNRTFSQKRTTASGFHNCPVSRSGTRYCPRPPRAAISSASCLSYCWAASVCHLPLGCTSIGPSFDIACPCAGSAGVIPEMWSVSTPGVFTPARFILAKSTEGTRVSSRNRKSSPLLRHLGPDCATISNCALRRSAMRASGVGWPLLHRAAAPGSANICPTAAAARRPGNMRSPSAAMRRPGNL